MKRATEQHVAGAPRSVPWAFSVCVGLLLVATAAGASWWIYSSEPTAERGGATRRSAMLVQTTDVARGDYRPRFVVIGHVEAKEDVQLSPRVDGQVIARSDRFEAGRLVDAGEWLVELDPADFENTVAQRLSALHQAEANLELEMGRQRVAELDYDLLEEEVPEASRGLILRKPQLDVARADVESARALLEQAQLDLARTKIPAPFDAQVLSRNVTVGSQVARGSSLGRLVGIRECWVVATVPLDKLQHVQTRQADSEGSRVTLRHPTAWPAGTERHGRVENIIGALHETTRLARINVRVDDPLALEREHRGLPPLVLGSLLEVSIEGAPIRDVIRISRGYLREDDTVWVERDGVLRILPVIVALEDADFAYIRDGLPADARVVTTGLSSVVDGAPLRTRADGEEPPDGN